MENVINKNLTINHLVNQNSEYSFKPGNLIPARVIENLPDGMLLSIGTAKIKAEVGLQIPKGEIINLLVVANDEGKLVMSINKDAETLSSIIPEITSSDLEEIQTIIKRLEKNNVKINLEEVINIKNFIKQMPLNSNNVLDLLLNPLLYTALMNKFTNNDYLLLTFESKKNKKTKQQEFHVNINFQSQEIGKINVSLIKGDLLKIIFSCSEKNTADLINKQSNILNENLSFIANKKILVNFNPSLANNKNLTEDNIRNDNGLNILV